MLLETYTTTTTGMVYILVWATFKAPLSSGLDGDLERTTAVHLVERGLVVLELEDVRNLHKHDRVSIVDTALS